MNFREAVVQAIAKAGKQETLATLLDLSPSALSKRINGETGWMENEVEFICQYIGVDLMNKSEFSRKLEVLKEAMKIMLNDEGDKS